MTARHQAASRSCAGEMPSHSRPSQDHMNCSCGVSQGDSSLSTVTIDLRFDLVMIAGLIPPPLGVFRSIGVQPSTLEGHLRSLDHPPELLA